MRFKSHGSFAPNSEIDFQVNNIDKGKVVYSSYAIEEQ